MQRVRNVARVCVVASALVSASSHGVPAEVAEGESLRDLDPGVVIREHVLPNVYTGGERAHVRQVTIGSGTGEQVDRFVREAIIQPDHARIVIQYETGTRPRYVDTLRGGTRRQEYQVSPSRPVRRIQTGADFAIKGSAYSFRDLHWRLEDYEWVEKEPEETGLRLTGLNGSYPRIVLSAEWALGALVVTRMEMFGSDGQPLKRQHFERFIEHAGTVRPSRIEMIDLGPRPEQPGDDIVTTLEIDWQ